MKKEQIEKHQSVFVFFLCQFLYKTTDKKRKEKSYKANTS